jgi:hypothetical protein
MVLIVPFSGGFSTIALGKSFVLVAETLKVFCSAQCRAIFFDGIPLSGSGATKIL